MKDRMTTEQIEVRIWATVIVSMVAILVVASLSMVLSVAFVPQEETLKPVDAKFLDITEKIILMIISGLAGFLGRTYIHKKAADIAEGDKDDSDSRAA